MVLSHAMGRDVDYLASGAWTEPAEERHANVAGQAGAQCSSSNPGRRPTDSPRRAATSSMRTLSTSSPSSDGRRGAPRGRMCGVSRRAVAAGGRRYGARATRTCCTSRASATSPRRLAAVAAPSARVSARTPTRSHQARRRREKRWRPSITPGARVSCSPRLDPRRIVRRLHLEWAASRLREVNPQIAGTHFPPASTIRAVSRTRSGGTSASRQAQWRRSRSQRLT